SIQIQTTCVYLAVATRPHGVVDTGAGAGVGGFGAADFEGVAVEDTDALLDDAASREFDAEDAEPDESREEAEPVVLNAAAWLCVVQPANEVATTTASASDDIRVSDMDSSCLT